MQMELQGGAPTSRPEQELMASFAHAQVEEWAWRQGQGQALTWPWEVLLFLLGASPAQPAPLQSPDDRAGFVRCAESAGGSVQESEVDINPGPRHFAEITTLQTRRSDMVLKQADKIYYSARATACLMDIVGERPQCPISLSMTIVTLLLQLADCGFQPPG